ncbi:MAG: long-chain fatty acid--CoA ligase [Calditrichaeota bacterium]|nr:long-chain fatty acid--CoA ligase [Calditrichota bacterium]HQU71420.1 fatty acid--CoA ligase family protein [Calditrichia bacterium]
MGPFLVEPSPGKVTTYSDLVKWLNAPGQFFSPFVKTESVFLLFANVIASLVSDYPVTILDTDFSPAEIKACLGEPSALDVKVKLRLSRPISTFEDLIESCRAKQNWRITLFTSGTAGIPKKVEHTFASLTREVRTGAKYEGAVWGSGYNPTHIAGLQVFFQALMNHNCYVNLFGEDREVIFDALERYQITHLSATPSFYRLLIPFNRVYSHLQRLSSGGEKFSLAIKNHLHEAFPNAKILNIYASTEAGTLFAARGEVFEVKSRFRNLVKIENGRLLLADSLLASSSEIVLADGWYDTGDVVEVVSEDPLSFKFVRRESELINVGGNRVDPNEVEAILRNHPQVRNARVFPKANSVLGNILCCEILKSDEHLTEKDLREHLSKSLQNFKVPRIYTFVDQISSSRTGKISRSK